jgi:hypothetical protein
MPCSGNWVRLCRRVTGYALARRRQSSAVAAKTPSSVFQPTDPDTSPQPHDPDVIGSRRPVTVACVVYRPPSE